MYSLCVAFAVYNGAGRGSSVNRSIDWLMSVIGPAELHQRMALVFGLSINAVCHAMGQSIVGGFKHRAASSGLHPARHLHHAKYRVNGLHHAPCPTRYTIWTRMAAILCGRGPYQLGTWHSPTGYLAFADSVLGTRRLGTWHSPTRYLALADWVLVIRRLGT